MDNTDDLLNPFEIDESAPKLVKPAPRQYLRFPTTTEISVVLVFFFLLTFMLSKTSQRSDSDFSTIDLTGEFNQSTSDYSGHNTNSPVFPANLIEYLRDKIYIGVGDEYTSGIEKEAVGLNSSAYQYSTFFNSLLEQSMIHVEVLNLGAVDDTCSTILKKLPSILSKKTTGVVGIECGWNDLKRKGTSAEKVMQNLVKLHRVVHDSSLISVFSVAFTIPILSTTTKSQSTDQLALNKMIRQFVKKCPTKIVLLDIASLLDPSLPINSIFWTENKQTLTDLGFDKIGKSLFDSLEKFSLENSVGNTKLYCTYDEWDQ